MRLPECSSSTRTGGSIGPDARPTYTVIEDYAQLTGLVREHLGVDL